MVDMAPPKRKACRRIRTACSCLPTARPPHATRMSWQTASRRHREHDPANCGRPRLTCGPSMPRAGGARSIRAKPAGSGTDHEEDTRKLETRNSKLPSFSRSSWPAEAASDCPARPSPAARSAPARLHLRPRARKSADHAHCREFRRPRHPAPGQGGQLRDPQRPAALATATSATDPVLPTRSTRYIPLPRAADRKLETRNSKLETPYAVVMLYGNVPVRAAA